MAALCMVQLDLPTLISWNPFTITLYVCVWVLSGLHSLTFRTSPAVSLCVQATKPPLALRRKKLALQYCLKLRANTNNPAYNAVWHKPSQTRPLGFRVEDDMHNLGFKKKNVLPTIVSTSHLGISNALTATSVYAVTIKQLLTQKCSCLLYTSPSPRD